MYWNSGLRHLAERRVINALADFQRAAGEGHDACACAAQAWFCHMLLGDFESAWKKSDFIAAQGKPDPHRLWNGETFAGKRVIVRCLHGFGDTIQFLRYARFLARDAAAVYVETHPEMVSVVERMPHIDGVMTWADESSKRFTEWDRQIEVMELPRVFRTTIDMIPCQVPYVFIDAQARERSRGALGGAGQRRIGLLWGSSEWNPARSVALSLLRPIMKTPGAKFYSFQRGSRRGELEAWPELHDTARHSPEIIDTAADLSNMDLLICVDTMAAHLAGALNVPVWVLLPFEADWRWMLDRRDSPWYPSMSLFRQPGPGDWETPVREIAAMLR